MQGPPTSLTSFLSNLLLQVHLLWLTIQRCDLKLKTNSPICTWNLSNAIFINYFSKLKYCVIYFISVLHDMLYSINTGSLRERNGSLCPFLFLGRRFRFKVKTLKQVRLLSILFWRSSRVARQQTYLSNWLQSFNHRFLIHAPPSIEKKAKEKISLFMFSAYFLLLFFHFSMKMKKNLLVTSS